MNWLSLSLFLSLQRIPSRGKFEQEVIVIVLNSFSLFSVLAVESFEFLDILQKKAHSAKRYSRTERKRRCSPKREY